MISRILFLFTVLVLSACDNPAKDVSVQADEVNTDYREKWGADEYGMRQYVMALLKEGPNRDQDSTTAANLQKAHLENITRMAEEGKLVIAGPFIDSWEVKGIYIFAVETIEEARALTATDPAIQAGRLEMDLHPWYASAAIMELNELYNKMEVKSITE